MPPKGDPLLLTERDQFFLVECIKSSKEKLVPNFDAVAQATQMSKKGAGNKFRDIMKRFEAAGGHHGTNGAPTAKANTKRAKSAMTKKGTSTAESGGEDEEYESEEDEPPKKKATTTKTKAKATTKPKAGAKQSVTKNAMTIMSQDKSEEDSDHKADDDGEDQGGEADGNEETAYV